MNKKIVKSIAFALFLAQFHFILAGVIIPEPGLTIVNDGDSVKLSWSTSDQSDLKHFVVQRRAMDGAFIDLATLQPEDDMNYEYIDRSVYKTEDTVYRYRLLIIEKDGRNSSLEASVTYSNVSSVRRTWGSIKALFR